MSRRTCLLGFLGPPRKLEEAVVALRGAVECFQESPVQGADGGGYEVELQLGRGGEVELLHGAPETGVAGAAPGFACVSAADGVHEGVVAGGGEVEVREALDDGWVEARGVEEVDEILAERRHR